MVETILVPLDGSPVAEQALPLALAVAQRTGAALELVQVHECYAFKDPACSWGPYDPKAEAALKSQEKAYLENTRKLLEANSPVQVGTSLIDGGVAEALLDSVKTRKADLVVMTTHGRGPVSRAFLGSVADELIRRAPCPILLLRPQEVAPAMGAKATIHKVLIPLDGSALAEQALGPAFELGQAMRASYVLFHVAPGGVDRTADLPGPAQARRYLEASASRLSANGGEVQVHLVTGRHVASAILEEARAMGCDLIALATHGRGGLKRLILGSVADKVLRAASMPLLVCCQT
jgi:nucleotide-binding universal stress UspA family protein